MYIHCYRIFAGDSISRREIVWVAAGVPVKLYTGGCWAASRAACGCSTTTTAPLSAAASSRTMAVSSRTMRGSTRKCAPPQAHRPSSIESDGPKAWPTGHRGPRKPRQSTSSSSARSCKSTWWAQTLCRLRCTQSGSQRGGHTSSNSLHSKSADRNSSRLLSAPLHRTCSCPSKHARTLPGTMHLALQAALGPTGPPLVYIRTFVCTGKQQEGSPHYHQYHRRRTLPSIRNE